MNLLLIHLACFSYLSPFYKPLFGFIEVVASFRFQSCYYTGSLLFYISSILYRFNGSTGSMQRDSCVGFLNKVSDSILVLTFNISLLLSSLSFFFVYLLASLTFFSSSALLSTYL